MSLEEQKAMQGVGLLVIEGLWQEISLMMVRVKQRVVS